MPKKELILHLFVTAPFLSIIQAIYAANLARNLQDETLGYDWTFSFFIYLLLHIPMNFILSFAFFGISIWFKKITLNLLVYNVIGLAGVGALVFLQQTDAVYAYSTFFVISIISILLHQKNQKAA